jgi:formylglycine-generating enzyme required for sulfatase activity
MATMKSKEDLRLRHRVLLAAALFSFTSTLLAVGPTVSNVRSAQRAGTQLVDIDYDLADADSATLTVTIAVSTNGGASYTLPAASFTGALGTGVARGTGKRITWNAGVDWPNKFSANVRFRVTADDAAAPSGMALIPAGSFTMGDTFNDSDISWGERPTHSVFVAAFYMDRYEVTKAQWDEVYQWATNRPAGVRYSFDYGDSGQGKAANHPAQTMTWYDAVKWCNARSEKENKTPAYYTSAALTTVYRSGPVDVQTNWVNWSSGYRLPTEAEWEKAARGGASGHRFPWSNVDTITHSQANYYSSSSYAYDISPTRGYHQTFTNGVAPYTSPVGYFSPNGYGLYDMAGNVWEWCWDWWSGTYYSSSPGTDPRGPATGSDRVIRGGGWVINAIYCRTAYRDDYGPANRSLNIGFRSVLPLVS